jgi:hypothetical protein
LAAELLLTFPELLPEGKGVRALISDDDDDDEVADVPFGREAEAWPYESERLDGELSAS